MGAIAPRSGSIELVPLVRARKLGTGSADEPARPRAPRTPDRGARGRARAPRSDSPRGHGNGSAIVARGTPFLDGKSTQSRRADRSAGAAAACTPGPLDAPNGPRSARRGRVRRRNVGEGRSASCRPDRGRRGGVASAGGASSEPRPLGRFERGLVRWNTETARSRDGGKKRGRGRRFDRCDRAPGPPAAERLARVRDVTEAAAEANGADARRPSVAIAGCPPFSAGPSRRASSRPGRSRGRCAAVRCNGPRSARPTSPSRRRRHRG